MNDLARLAQVRGNDADDPPGLILERSGQVALQGIVGLPGRLDDPEPGAAQSRREPVARSNARSRRQRASGAHNDAVRIRDRDPIEFGIDRQQFVEDIAETASLVRRRNVAELETGGAHRAEPRCERLTQIGAQLVGFQRKPPHVLLNDVLARDPADPDGSGGGERDRERNDQPHGARRQAVRRVEIEAPGPRFAGRNGIGHGRHVNR